MYQFLSWKKVIATSSALGSAIFLYSYLDTIQRITISPDKFVPLDIIKVSPVNHNTNIYRLKLPRSLKEPLPVVSFFHIKDDSIQILREYTPISSSYEKNHIDFLIKRYDHGYLSRYIYSKNVGEHLEVRGPFVTFPYFANMKKYIGMICGGTGITPMYQIINQILNNPADQTKIYLIYANVTKQDILLYQELEQLTKNHPDQLKIYYTLEYPPKDELWTQGIGYISKNMVQNHIPGPQNDILILVCGPDGMIKYVSGEKTRNLSQGPIGGLLKNINYSQKQ
ncbi:96_t:CDS:2, partial [Diversispora eburnea]